MSPRAIAYGGGVQSTALLVLAAQRRIDFPVFLFANVGDDSEDPATLAYIEQYAKPYAALHGIQLHELHRTLSDGSVETLYGRMTKPGSKALPIPVRGENGAPMKRACTHDFKIEVMGRWLKANGASENNKATVGIGISLDEIERVNNRKAQPYENPVYPLLSLGEDTGLHMRRDDCGRIILDAGLPIPPKSACWFCPFRKPSNWAEMRRDNPDQFERACALEATLSNRGQDERRYWLTRFGRPMAEAIPVAQDELPGLGDAVDLDDAECDNGVCFV